MFTPYANVIGLPDPNTLTKIRQNRNFRPLDYIDIKIHAINQYFKQNNLSVAVIGISGGIDSAICLHILRKVKELPNSSLKHIVPVMIYADDRHGVTNNDKIWKLVKSAFNSKEVDRIDIHSVVKNHLSNFNQVVREVVADDDFMPNQWTIGQCVAHARTSTLAGICTEFTQVGLNAIIIGTTNKDEYSYLGYVGKYSDGLVDLQIISDLHKSEVYRVAKCLQVDQRIINKAPNGDMFNGATDEQVFGVTYDAVEWVTSCYASGFPIELIDNWSEILNRVDKLHQQNAHKYATGIPCVELDILNAGCKHGGKSLNLSERYYNILNNIGDIVKNNFVKGFNVGFQDNMELQYRTKFLQPSRTSYKKDIMILPKCIPESCIKLLTELHLQNNQCLTDVHGVAQLEIDFATAQSYRNSLYSVGLSENLWKFVRNYLPTAFIGDGYSTEWEKDSVWVPVGINPLFRFIQYVQRGQLVAHYDRSFVDQVTSHKRVVKSLFSLVIYLDTVPDEGTTFYLDNTDKTDLSDLTIEQTNKLLKIQIVGQTGDICIFPHHLLHGSTPSNGKIVIRTDVMCEKIV